MTKTKAPTKKTAPAPDPVLYEPPTVAIAGRLYTMRRLGIRDVFAVARVISAALGDIRDAGGILTGTNLLPMILDAMVREEKVVLELLAGTIGVTPQELSDPEQFPLDSVIDLIEALSEHQDLAAFFSRSAEMTKKIQAKRETLAKP
ncbi:MAG: hypothetical protein WC972_11930 [Trueperaceae bacterium]